MLFCQSFVYMNKTHSQFFVRMLVSGRAVCGQTYMVKLVRNVPCELCGFCFPPHICYFMLFCFTMPLSVGTTSLSGYYSHRKACPLRRYLPSFINMEVARFKLSCIGEEASFRDQQQQHQSHRRMDPSPNVLGQSAVLPINWLFGQLVSWVHMRLVIIFSPRQIFRNNLF